MRVLGPVVLCAALAAAARASRVHVRVSNADAAFSALTGDDGDGVERESAVVAAAATSNTTANTSPVTTPGGNATVTTSSNATSTTNKPSSAPPAATPAAAKKAAGRQKCSVMNKYNWTDFTHVCEFFHAASGYNVFYRRKDNATFVYECECEKTVEGSYGAFSATKWTWTPVASTVDCFSRRGKELKNVDKLFDSVSCLGTEKKFCDTKTNCTRW